ncbi:Amidase 1 [Exophiala dermatitidis]
MEWEAAILKKKAQRTASIQKFSRLEKSAERSTFAERLVGNVDVPTLTKLYAEGNITVEDIVVAFIARGASCFSQMTLLTSSETNCLTEVLFENALQQARELDRYHRQHRELIGPLHGVPVSLKDQFDIASVDTTFGYVGRSFQPASKDATVTKILKDLGAVILTKTNVPQTILWGETENPIWGLTTLPHKPAFTAGGSSGGEAALLALDGALCGWGTDIGGSIRGPSHFNGLFGLKPTSSRISHRGVPGPHEGQEHVPSSVGPMSKRLTSLVTVTRAVLNAQAWLSDPKVVPIPWREGLYLEVQTRRLKIGLILDDGIVKPHPPVERAVKEAAALLRNAGHEVIIWDTSEHMGFIEIQDQFYRADGGEDIRRDISAGGEPMIPHVEALVESSKAISVYEYWQLNKAKMLAQQAYNEKWTKSGVDVLLSPVAGHTALPHRCFRYTGYTKIWNFLDYTAMSFPFTTVSEDLDSEDICRTSGTDTSALDEVRNPLDTYNQGLWDLASMKGLPVGVQIIGRRFDEEKVLGVAKVLEKEIEKQKQV